MKVSLAERLRCALDVEMSTDQLVLGHLAGSPNSGDGSSTPAAVLIGIIDRPEPGVILTVRSDMVRRYAGHIAFPGGRFDPNDEGVVATALREAEEEIGLPHDKVQVIGVTDNFRTTTGFDVTPVVGIIPPSLEFIAQPGEVAAVFEVPLYHLLQSNHHNMRTDKWKGDERRYYEILWEGQRIWGATAAMIVNLSRRLNAT